MLVLEQIHRGQAGCARNGVRRVGVPVWKFDRVMRATRVHKGLVERIGRYHTTHRNRSIGDLLCEVEEVRCNAECFSPGPGT